MRFIRVFSVGLFLLPIHAMAALDCNTARNPQPTPSAALQLTPIAEELSATGFEMQGAGFASLIDDRVAVEQAVTRLHRYTCVAPAAVANPPKSAGGTSTYRFNMTQNGKRMTADEFDAWMKAQGVRVVKGPATATPAPTPAPAAAPEPPKKKKKR
jgi:hypothetical protein